MKKAGKIAAKVLGGAAAAYAGLFVVFYFDLDGKILFNVVEPLLQKHYDNMERKDPLSVEYKMVDDDKKYI
ncbi:MAG: hypothetical protein KBS68_00140 [Clostridiales bacterium]|nr:hypothetical protein [Candidatus Crickella merdequi]